MSKRNRPQNANLKYARLGRRAKDEEGEEGDERQGDEKKRRRTSSPPQRQHASLPAAPPPSPPPQSQPFAAFVSECDVNARDACTRQPPAWPLPFKYDRAAFVLEVGDADAHRVLTELLKQRISAANGGTEAANIVTPNSFCDGSRRSNTTPAYVIVEDLAFPAAYPAAHPARPARQQTASRAVRLFERATIHRQIIFLSRGPRTHHSRLHDTPSRRSAPS